MTNHAQDYQIKHDKSHDNRALVQQTAGVISPIFAATGIHDTRLDHQTCIPPTPTCLPGHPTTHLATQPRVPIQLGGGGKQVPRSQLKRIRFEGIGTQIRPTTGTAPAPRGEIEPVIAPPLIDITPIGTETPTRTNNHLEIRPKSSEETTGTYSLAG